MLKHLSDLHSIRHTFIFPNCSFAIIAHKNMQEVKNIIGIIAVILVFIGYIPYLRDVIKGKTIPHIYSWFLWGFVSTIAFALQISDNAGIGAFVTLAAAIMCTLVAVLSFKHKGKWDITLIDTLFLLLAFISLGIWLFAKQPVVSIILTTTTDILGFVPTVRKSWNRPYSETLSLYSLNTFRFGLAIIAIQNYSIITTLYPIVWLLANGLFALMLILRRSSLHENQNE